MIFKLAGRHRIKRLGPFTFKIDRPKGFVKTWGSKSFTYPCDYGYFPGVKGEDGEALDAFVGDDLSGRMESFLKLKKDQSGNLVPDETKFLVGVSDKDAKKIYALYGDEVSQRVTYESVDALKAAVKEFKPMKKGRYESVEEKTAGPALTGLGFGQKPGPSDPRFKLLPNESLPEALLRLDKEFPLPKSLINASPEDMARVREHTEAFAAVRDEYFKRRSSSAHVSTPAPPSTPIPPEPSPGPGLFQRGVAGFKKLPRSTQALMVTPAALLSAYGLYRGGKAMVDHFSPREEETPTKLAATQVLERFGIKAASAKTADLYKKLLGEIMARKRGKTTEKTAANKMFRVLRDMPDGPERDALIARMSEAWAMPQYAYPADRVAQTLEAKADSPARGFGRELINETRALPWDAPSSVRDALEYRHIKQYNNTLANEVDPTSLVYRQNHLPGLLEMKNRWRLSSGAKILDALQKERKQWEALPRASDVSAPVSSLTPAQQPLAAQLLPSVPQSVPELSARLQAAAEELADLTASEDKRHAAAKDLHGVATAMSAGAEALAAHNARPLGDFGPPPKLKTEGASNPAGPQSMYARFRKLPRLAQGAIVTPAALLSAYGLYRGGKALVNHFSPEEGEEQPTKLGAAELAYKLAPSLANAYDAYQATSAALDAQKEQEERMRFPALHATQPERMMNAMYGMDPSSTGSFDSPPVHHRRHRRQHH